MSEMSDVSDAKPQINAPEVIAALARQVSAGVEPVPSPCISVCRMNKSTALCAGCFRTIEEICLWSKSDDAAKRAMWGQVAQRAAQSTVQSVAGGAA